MSSVVVISRSKNEADIIEAWVRHTLWHVDHLIVSDNDSSDRTLEILKALQAEGLPLTIRTEAVIGDYQARRFTELLREAAAMGAGFIVPLDTDEALETDPAGYFERDEFGPKPPTPRFADLLTQGPQGVRSLAWKSMVVTPDTNMSIVNPVERLMHRLTDETHYQKISVPAHMAKDPARSLCTGSHFLLPDGDRGVPVVGARICHFPLRSVDQYRLKAVIAYLQSACVPGWIASGQGFQFGSLPNAQNIEMKALVEYSQRYASQMPRDWQPKCIEQALDYKGGPLRYTTPSDDSRFLTVLLKHCEKMALEIAALNTPAMVAK